MLDRVRSDADVAKDAARHRVEAKLERRRDDDGRDGDDPEGRRDEERSAARLHGLGALPRAALLPAPLRQGVLEGSPRGLPGGSKHFRGTNHRRFREARG